MKLLPLVKGTSTIHMTKMNMRREEDLEAANESAHWWRYHKRQMYSMAKMRYGRY
jgi:hypothetical protein